MDWMQKWFSPSDNHTRTLEEIIAFIRARENYSIYVGCDSHIAKGTKNKYLFAIAVCLIGKDSSSGNRYFYTRGIYSRPFDSLKERLTQEVSFSAEVAMKINHDLPNRTVTLHADTGSDHKAKSSKFTEAFRKWANGIGCEFASKPDAWASSAIADKHSK